MKPVPLLIVTNLLLITIAPALGQPETPSTTPTSQPTTRPFRLSYKLASGAENWDPQIRKRIIDAMDAAVALYNELGEFDKTVTANYNPRTPTADANYNGWINFGGQINKRVALHEIGHTLGVGQHRNWRRNIVDGKWTGQHALALVREYDGPDATLSADRQHFWPYGLNYDRESSEENDRRHVKMVEALRKDMGIVNGR
jgi:hypothetical protein